MYCIIVLFCYDRPMQKAEIKKWLKDIGKDRDWLAEQCGVTRGGINIWLSSSRPIPRQTGKLIVRLMAQYPAADSIPATPPNAADNAITLTVDDATFDAWNNAATAEGKLLRQWCVDVINESLE